MVVYMYLQVRKYSRVCYSLWWSRTYLRTFMLVFSDIFTFCDPSQWRHCFQCMGLRMDGTGSHDIWCFVLDDSTCFTVPYLMLCWQRAIVTGRDMFLVAWWCSSCCYSGSCFNCDVMVLDFTCSIHIVGTSWLLLSTDVCLGVGWPRVHIAFCLAQFLDICIVSLYLFNWRHVRVDW